MKSEDLGQVRSRRIRPFYGFNQEIKEYNEEDAIFQSYLVKKKIEAVLLNSVRGFSVDGYQPGHGYMGITSYIIIIILDKKPILSIYPSDIDKVSNSTYVLNIYWKDENQKVSFLKIYNFLDKTCWAEI